MLSAESQLGPAASQGYPLESDSDEESDMIVVIPEGLKSPAESTVCRICLITEGRMERVTDKYEEAYREVVGLKWNTTDWLPQHICWECSHRLLCALRLRQKALTTHKILHELRNGCFITLDDIQVLDRDRLQLSSKLSQKHFPPTEYVNTDKNDETTQHMSKPIDDNVRESELASKENTTETFDFKNVIGNIDVSIATLVKDAHFEKDSDDSSDCLIIDDAEFKDTDSSKSEVAVDEKDSIIKRLLSKPLMERKPCPDLLPWPLNKTDKSDVTYTDNSDKGKSLFWPMNTTIEKLDVSASDAIDDEATPNMPWVRNKTIDNADSVATITKMSKDEEMPIDDLIDIYNNDEDGDERLQELNERFREASVQLNQCWGGQRPVEECINETKELKPPRKPKRPASRIPRDTANEQSKHSSKVTRTYNKLDRGLFKITSVTEAEQIAEVLQRQESDGFKRARFKCMVCYRGFKHRHAYDKHILKHDAASGAFECTICRARQKSVRAMKAHMHGQHTERVACTKCKFVTMNRSVARGHQTWHAGVVYRCPHCSTQFSKVRSYNLHVRTQHAHAHACALCGHTYVSAKGLAVHRCRRHADADKIPLRGPTCDTCELRFVSEEAYSRHLKLSSRHLADNTPSLIELRMAGN